MKVYDLIRFGRSYADLGTSIQEQIDDVLAGRIDEVNINAIKLAKKRLGEFDNTLSNLLDDAIKELDS